MFQVMRTSSSLIPMLKVEILREMIDINKEMQPRNIQATSQIGTLSMLDLWLIKKRK